MSMFGEYLVAVRKGLENLPNVIEGNKNFYLDAFGVLPEDQKQEADRRYAICKTCPFNSINAKGIGFYPTNRIDEHCSVCKCPIEKKVMSFNEQCGLSYLTNLVDGSGRAIVDGWVPLWYEYNNENK